MKKIFAIALLATITLVSCTKERVDEPIKKDVYQTYYFQVDGVEAGGTYSTPITYIRIKEN